MIDYDCAAVIRNLLNVALKVKHDETLTSQNRLKRRGKWNIRQRLSFVSFSCRTTQNDTNWTISFSYFSLISFELSCSFRSILKLNGRLRKQGNRASIRDCSKRVKQRKRSTENIFYLCNLFDVINCRDSLKRNFTAEKLQRASVLTNWSKGSGRFA